ncbi:hypothetical protein [Nocardia altamirensis]|uniref:hypothetical protein n=1 Tax=Nocardia altamirensis TaxID=472158 RepID=UPI000840103D|nr:hypothetical protein [Nocardia altamirensis]
MSADKAHRSGLKIIGVTLTPSEGAQIPATTYGLPTTLANRRQVNDFIRQSGIFDSVLDFDAAVVDPAHPDRWAQGLSPSNDNVHPNDQGSQQEADAIDVPALLGVAGCR